MAEERVPFKTSAADTVGITRIRPKCLQTGVGSAGAPLQVHPLGPVEQQQVESVRPEGVRPYFGAQSFPRGDGFLAFSHRLPFVGQHLAKRL